MKLLFAHECFGAFGGAESNVFHTAGEFKRRGHTVGLVHGPSTGKGEAQWEALFEDRYPMSGPGAMEQAVREFQPDSVYVHKLADLEALSVLAGSSRPVVRMVHDHEIFCLRGCRYGHLSRKVCTRPLSPFCLFPCGGFIGRNHQGGLPVKWVSYQQRKQEMQMNRRFARLIVATNYMKEELLLNDFDERKIEVHPPTPPRLSSPGPGTSSEGNLLIYSGQITRGKGVDVLLRALKLIRTDFQCLIFGDGGHSAYCENLCHKLGLAERVQFRGFVSQEELQSHYSRASVMVVSSVWPEPFGAVGLEGMHHGLPVVAFDAGGIKEWLIDGYNGFLVPWMDHERYASCVEQLLHDKTLAKRMGECGRQLADERFSFTSYVDGLENMFERVVGRKQEEVCV